MTGESSANLLVGGLGILFQQGDGGHNQAGRTVAALDRLFIDEGLLYRMQTVQCPKPLQGDDFAAGDFTHRDATGRQRLPVDQDLAGAALFHPAGQFGGLQAHVIAQYVDQRRVRIDAQRMRLPVDAQAHGTQL